MGFSFVIHSGLFLQGLSVHQKHSTNVVLFLGIGWTVTMMGLAVQSLQGFWFVVFLVLSFSVFVLVGRV